MSCFNQYQIFDFINKELPEKELSQIEKHLQDCSICRSIYEQKISEIDFLKNSLGDFDDSTIVIPEFLGNEVLKNNKEVKMRPLIMKLGIAASILILVSFSLIFLLKKDKQEIDMQLLLVEQEMAITEMNEAWHNRELVITHIDEKTGNAEVYLSSDIKN